MAAAESNVVQANAVGDHVASLALRLFHGQVHASIIYTLCSYVNTDCS